MCFMRRAKGEKASIESDVIQINRVATGERAASLMLLERLRNERERIQAEIDRVTRELNEQISQEANEPGSRILRD
jgi:uncharacterized sporulation protein YeaH/YhbH (DUF444 family)